MVAAEQPPGSPSGTGQETKTRLRKSWLAGLLAFICPGLGHAYCGRPWTAIAVHYAPAAFGLLALSVAVVADTALLATMIASILVGFVIWVVQLVWAVRLARRLGETFRLRRYNHVLVYIAMFLGFYVVDVSNITKAVVVEAFKIPTAAMMPTFEIGDQIFVTKLGERASAPERGDIVVFETPIPPYEAYIKRVVGLPGEEIEVREGVICINGTAIERKEAGTATFWDRDMGTGHWYSFEAKVFEESFGDRTARVLVDLDDSQAAPNFGATTVPDRHYFVMGDNRDHSYDSRAWGPVPAENVVGTAHSIWWSWGKDGFRSNRLGRIQ